MTGSRLHNLWPGCAATYVATQRGAESVGEFVDHLLRGPRKVVELGKSALKADGSRIKELATVAVLTFLSSINSKEKFGAYTAAYRGKSTPSRAQPDRIASADGAEEIRIHQTPTELVFHVTAAETAGVTSGSLDGSEQDQYLEDN